MLRYAEGQKYEAHTDHCRKHDSASLTDSCRCPGLLADWQGHSSAMSPCPALP